MNLHRFSLKLRHTSCLPTPARAWPCENRGVVLAEVRKERESGTQLRTTGLGLSEHVAAVWSSPRQCGQRGMHLALPVNASLYRRAFGTDQFRSFRASMSRRNCRS